MKKCFLIVTIILILFSSITSQSVNSQDNSSDFFILPKGSDKITLTEGSFEDTSSVIYTANFSAKVIEVKANNDEVTIKLSVTNKGKSAFDVKVNCSEETFFVKTFPDTLSNDYSFEAIENNESVILDFSFINYNLSSLSAEITLDFLFSIEGCPLRCFKALDLTIALPEITKDQDSLTIFPAMLVLSIFIFLRKKTPS